MNANQLADMLECLGWRSVDANLREAATMLRRQHEAIVKLRSALKNYVESDETAREYGVGVGGDAMDIAEQALKDTEGL